MLLRNSEYKGTSSWDDVLRLAKGGMGRDPGGYRAEFVRLVEVARGMAGAGSDIGMREYCTRLRRNRSALSS